MSVESVDFADLSAYECIPDLNSPHQSSRTAKTSLQSILNRPVVEYLLNPRERRFFSATPLDLAQDITQAIADARSGNWAAAAADSLDVAQDIIDVAQKIEEELIQSRKEAIQNGFSENSDIGFQ